MFCVNSESIATLRILTRLALLFRLKIPLRGETSAASFAATSTTSAGEVMHRVYQVMADICRAKLTNCAVRRFVNGSTVTQDQRFWMPGFIL